VKLPTLDEILKSYDPKTGQFRAVRKLTTQQLAYFLEDIKKLVEGHGTLQLPPGPAELASKLTGGTYTVPRHIAVLSEALVALEKPDSRKLLISMPPRSGKSQLAGQWYPIWRLARNPRLRIIATSYEERFATSNLGRPVRDRLTAFQSELNVFIKPDKNSAGEWETTMGGGMVSVGTGGAIPGRSADLIVVDDAVKGEKESLSEIQREDMWNWFQTTVMSRLEPQTGIVVIGTRWHEDDLIGRIIHSYSFDGAPTWRNLCLPAEAEDGDDLGRAKGEWLWERMAEEYTDRKRLLSPYNWSAVYQQRPSPEGGGLLKRDWFNNTYTALPRPEQIDQWIQSWDLALSERAMADYTVGQVWIRSGASFYLVDQYRERAPLPDVIAQVRKWTMQYPKAIAKLIENKSSGKALIQMLRREIPGVVPIEPKESKVDRVVRSNSVIPALQAGNVYFPARPDGSRPQWVWELIEEAASFPKGKHDDQVDAMSQALNFLLPGGWQLDFVQAQAAQMAPVKRTPQEQMQAELWKTLNKDLSVSQREFARELRRRDFMGFGGT
jgi:predicted phage terminase large subunit-like protein